jgi:hypothetical protein
MPAKMLTPPRRLPGLIQESVMTIFVATKLIREKGAFGAERAWRRDASFLLFDEDANLVADTATSNFAVAQASAAHHDSGAFEDLKKLLELEAKFEGNQEAAALLRKWAHQ